MLSALPFVGSGIKPVPSQVAREPRLDGPLTLASCLRHELHVLAYFLVLTDAQVLPKCLVQGSLLRISHQVGALGQRRDLLILKVSQTREVFLVALFRGKTGLIEVTTLRT